MFYKNYKRYNKGVLWHGIHTLHGFKFYISAFSLVWKFGIKTNVKTSKASNNKSKN